MQLRAELVQAFLAKRFGQPVAELTRVEHGEWSKAFTFQCGGAGYVARFSPLDEDFWKDHRAMAFASADLPIPRILDIGAAFEGYYAISERASGEFLETLDGPGLLRVLPSLLAALDAARTADLTGSRGFGIWGADGNAPHADWREALLAVGRDQPGKRISGWRARLVGSPTGCAPFDTALARLASLVDLCPDTRHLIHSDLLYFNVLVAEERVSAVLDWGSSMYGDFLFDIAWLTFWQPWYPAWHGIDLAAAAHRHYASIGLEVPRFQERLRCYELYIGLGGQAYQALKGRWEDLAATARRTLALARD